MLFMDDLPDDCGLPWADFETSSVTVYKAMLSINFQIFWLGRGFRNEQDLYTLGLLLFAFDHEKKAGFDPLSLGLSRDVVSLNRLSVLRQGTSTRLWSNSFYRR
jgi:hypothetical protein